MTEEIWASRIASACDKQFHLQDLVGQLTGNLSIASGLLSFDEGYRWQVQFLGIESYSAGIWMWPWGGTSNRVSPELLHACCTMKTFGQQRDIPELIQPEVPLACIDGQSLSLLAVDVCQANGYYRCPLDGGNLFVLIKDEKFPKCPDPPLRRIATIFPQVLTSFDISDHKLALTGYLDHYGLGYERDGEKLLVKDHGEVVLAATFDDQNRLTALEVELESNAEPSGQSWDERQIQRMLRA